MKYVERFRVPPGTAVKLEDVDPTSKNHHERHKKAVKGIEVYRKRLRELQALLYADGRRSFLLCLQALDAGCKSPKPASTLMPWPPSSRMKWPDRLSNPGKHGWPASHPKARR